MLQYIIQQGGKTPKDFLGDPKNSIKNVTSNVISKQTLDQMKITWASKTGRCTSFAVKAISDLSLQKAQGQPVYDFKIYDLGRHRVARCAKTTVVIDSSSTLPGGAFPLPEGAWARFPETNASWKFKSSESKFEREGNVEGTIVSFNV
jgi:hypothetical protein